MERANKITFFHYSDLHYDSDAKYEFEIIKNALIEDIKRVKSELNIIPDFIVFSGDLVRVGAYYDEFINSFDDFISPILKEAGLTENDLFISIGNHDIDRNKIKKYFDDGIHINLNSRSDVNNLINNFDDYSSAFERLSNYSNFLDELSNKYQVKKDDLFRTYKINIKDYSIGIASLNTSWLATGASNNGDFGKLLIGEMQIKKAANTIKECNLKIAVFHHPNEWLKPFEQSYITQSLYQEFDFLCVGHNHDPNAKITKDINNSIIISNAGSLYQTREYYNGYSIVDIDMHSMCGNIYLRSYFDKRISFDAALDQCSNGIVSFEIRRPVTSSCVRDKKENNEKVVTLLRDNINKNLLSSSIPDTIAPKDIAQIFVEPYFSKAPGNVRELESEKEKNRKIQLSDILKSKDNYLIIGPKESGKTTILNFIALSSFDSVSTDNQEKIPLLMDYKNISMGKPVVSVIRAISCNIEDCISEFDVKKILTYGKCILLVDNIDNDPKKYSKFKEFVKEFKNNRFIFTANETLEKNLDLTKDVNFGLQYKKIFIKPFNRNQTRKLIDNWFKGSIYDSSLILNKTLSLLIHMRVPTTPVFISLILSLYEVEQAGSLINKAALIEKFIELLFGKFSKLDIKYCDIDHKDKENYLSIVAQKMIYSQDNFIPSMLELEQITIEYFKNRNLDISISPFINFFFDQGVLKEFDGKIYFRFDCFFEFFSAKRMIDCDKFYSFVLSEDNYLKYTNAIDYFTGLKRNSLDVLKLIENRADIISVEKFFDINFSYFDNIDCDLFPHEKEERSKMLELRSSLSEEEKDDILDISDIDMELTDQENASIEKYIADKSYYVKIKHITKLIKITILLSNILRNCDHIEDLCERQRILNNCFKYWAILLAAITDIHLSLIDKASLDDNDKESSTKLSLIATPLITLSLLQENISSEKLKLLIKESNYNSDNETIKFFTTFIYSHLKFSDHIGVIELFMKNTNKYFSDISLYILHYNYIFENYPEGDLRKIESIISEASIFRNNMKSNSMKGKIIKNFNRNRMMQELRKERMFKKQSMKQ